MPPLGAQAPHALVGVIAGKSRQIHAGDRAQQPCRLPFFFYRPPRDHAIARAAPPRWCSRALRAPNRDSEECRDSAAAAARQEQQSRRQRRRSANRHSDPRPQSHGYDFSRFRICCGPAYSRSRSRNCTAALRQGHITNNRADNRPTLAAPIIWMTSTPPAKHLSLSSSASRLPQAVPKPAFQGPQCSRPTRSASRSS